MAITNFQVFDENKQNMLGDAEYLNSSQRLNGVQAGVASSQLHNKASHQTSLMAAAIAQYMVSKNIDALDTDTIAEFADKIGSLFTGELVKIGNESVSSLASLLPADSINEVLKVALPGLWYEIADYKVAGAYEWTVPDLFGGKAYEIGVWLVGGGAGGSIGRYGGGSGQSRAMLVRVTPGETYNFVVGEGGLGGTGDSEYGAQGGSSSAFNEVSVGGLSTSTLSGSYRYVHSGQPATQSTSMLATGDEIPNRGKYPAAAGDYTTSNLYYPFMSVSNFFVCPFDPDYVLLAGGSNGSNSQNLGQTKNVETSKGKGSVVKKYYSSSLFSPPEYPSPSIGTMPGCGGGSNGSSNTASTSPGADGCVIIFTRRVTYDS